MIINDQTPEEWYRQIEAIATATPAIQRGNPDAVVGVAVDDARKRDYFVPHLQRLLNHHRWTVTFRVVPMNGDASVDLRRCP